MKGVFFRTLAAGAAVALLGLAQAGAQPGTQAAPDSSQGQNQGQAGRWRGGAGGFPGGGRGVLGTVTEVTAEHYTIKTDAGDVYTIHYSVNTRIMKAPAGQAGGRRRASSDSDEARPTPQTIKPTEIKVGDVITAGGEMDAANKSIGAVFIALVDPERAKQMREMQANFGKTWLAGRITAMDGLTITVEGMLDHAPHTITVDENTSFHQRRDSITLADIKPGEQLRAEGSVKGGVFLATQVNAAEPQERNPANGAPAGPQ